MGALRIKLFTWLVLDVYRRHRLLSFLCNCGFTCSNDFSMNHDSRARKTSVVSRLGTTLESLVKNVIFNRE
jgi:hypothetical protein